jgi:hypothetical protein
MKRLVNLFKSKTPANKFQGICLEVLNGQEFTACAVGLLQLNDDLRLTRVFETELLAGILSKLKRRYPIILTITGKGIVSKQIDTTKQNVMAVMPSANADHFLFQGYDLHDTIGTVIRKEIVEGFIKQINALGFLVEACYLDVVTAGGTFLYLNNNGVLQELRPTVCGKQIALTAEEVLRINPSTELETTFEMDDFQLRADKLLAYSGVFQHLVNPVSCTTIEHPILQQNKEDILFKKKTEFIGLWSAVSLLVFMLLASLIYMNFKQQQEQLSSFLTQSTQQISYLNNLEQEVAKRKRLAELIGVSERFGPAYYADRLAATKPKEMVFKEVNVNPLAKKIKENQEVRIDRNKILISGEVSKSIYLNNWIKDTQATYDWIKDITVVSYDAGKKIKVPQFVLAITIHE